MDIGVLFLRPNEDYANLPEWRSDNHDHHWRVAANTL